MTRLRDVLRTTDEGAPPALVGYLPIGYPDPDGFDDLVRTSVARGVRVLELGIPDPDTLLDGPVIREAAAVAARTVGSADAAIERAAEVERSTSVPVIVMAYRSAFADETPAGIARRVISRGVSAVLIPDAPYAERVEIARAAAELGGDGVIFLSKKDQVARLAASGPTAPIVYLQSRSAATGAAFDPDRFRRRMADVSRQLPEALVLVGFGISRPADVVAVRDTTAAAAVVGTAFVEAAAHGPSALGDYIGSLPVDLTPAPHPTVGSGPEGVS